MKVSKTAVYRITASMACGCVAQQEFEDADYKKPLSKEPNFTVCKKHKDQAGTDILEMVLTERVQEEAENHVAAPPPAPTNVRPDASASVDESGNLVMRVPIKQNPNVRVAAVRASGTTAVSGPPNTPVAAAVVGGRPVAPLPAPGAPRVASTTTAVARPSQAPINTRQAARTGPVKSYQRPTSSAETAARPVAASRPAPQDEEPDLFDQNDPDFNNAR